MLQVGKITNSLIPSLISLFNDYNKNLKTRFKADTLFMSLDEKTNKTFNKFINMSNERFKLVKFGENLNNVILNQKQSYSNIKRNIQNDLLYKTDYSNQEKKKLIKSVNSFKSKEIMNIRDKLYETLRNRTSMGDELRRKQMLLRKNKKKENLNKNNINNINNINIMSPNLHLHQVKSNDNNHDKNKDNSIKKNILIKNEEKKNIELIQQYTKDTIKNDHNNFMRGLELYKSLLRTKKNDLMDTISKSVSDNKYIKISRNDFKDIESIVNENNIKILSYNEENKNKKDKTNKVDDTFDITSLFRLKTYHNINKAKSNKYIFNKNQKIIFPKFKTNETEVNQNEINSINNDIKYQTISNYDMKNTIRLIKKVAHGSSILGEHFQNKRNKFNQFYETHFPKYDFRKMEKFIKYKSYKRLNKKKEEEYVPKKIIIKRKFSINEKLMDDFIKIYQNKLKAWNKEDKEKQIQEKSLEKQEENNYKFLLSLDRKKRKRNSKSINKNC